MIASDEYVVRLIDLPVSVGGFITESPDGFANIYLNARHGDQGRHRAFRHEIDHAENDDLHSTEPVEVIEARVLAGGLSKLDLCFFSNSTFDY